MKEALAPLSRSPFEKMKWLFFLRIPSNPFRIFSLNMQFSFAINIHYQRKQIVFCPKIKSYFHPDRRKILCNNIVIIEQVRSFQLSLFDTNVSKQGIRNKKKVLFISWQQTNISLTKDHEENEKTKKRFVQPSNSFEKQFLVVWQLIFSFLWCKNRALLIFCFCFFVVMKFCWGKGHLSLKE